MKKVWKVYFSCILYTKKEAEEIKRAISHAARTQAAEPRYISSGVTGSRRYRQRGDV